MAIKNFFNYRFWLGKFLDTKIAYNIKDDAYLKLKFYAIMGYKLDLENPKTMNEKMTQESQILNQVKDATKTLGKGTSSVSMILRPESLGKVSVNLTSHNGSVSAQFIAQNQQTADTISKNLEMLKQNLIDRIAFLENFFLIKIPLCKYNYPHLHYNKKSVVNKYLKSAKRCRLVA